MKLKRIIKKFRTRSVKFQISREKCWETLFQNAASRVCKFFFLLLVTLNVLCVAVQFSWKHYAVQNPSNEPKTN